jgi:hypothetical protein
MNIFVIIATAFQRNHLLVERSLLSVYQQVNIDRNIIKIMIVDDNIDDYTEVIKADVQKLRSKLMLNPFEFETSIIRNQRVKGNSGSGAWNTAIFKIYETQPNDYIAILDDDDAYLDDYLYTSQSIINANSELLGIFQQIKWINHDGSDFIVNLTKDLLTSQAFFIGNPGVQGSNMFFKCSSIVEINGFNENFPNTTDRELMIRFLKHLERQNGWQKFLHVEEKIGVLHYNHLSRRVSSDLRLKKIGLDLFYQTFRHDFSDIDYEKSILRAQKLFDYQPEI